MRGFVVLFSEKSGWSPADQQAADALAKNGAMVVGVDTERYAARLKSPAEKESCHNLVGDAEAVSHQLERGVQTSHYFAPIVAGTGQGAILAERIAGAGAGEHRSRARLSLDAEQAARSRVSTLSAGPDDHRTTRRCRASSNAARCKRAARRPTRFSR